MQDFYEINGRLIYDPPRPGMKKGHRAQPGWLVVEVDDGIGMFYRWLIKKWNGRILSPAAFGTHITVINDRDPDMSKHPNWKKYHGKNIKIKVVPRIDHHWRFWTIDVISDELQSIREELGLGKKKHPFHITVGRDIILEEQE